MTFDEALDELKREAFWSNGFPEIQEIEFEKVKYAVEKLREEYAPTVEMVTSEYVYFRSFRFSDRSFVDFYQAISNQSDLIKFGLKQTPVYFVDLSENELMQAWLHPATIKVIGEENDATTSSRNED